MLNAKERLEQGDDDATPGVDMLSLIASLDRMHKMGILSDEEFNQKKDQLLSRV
jgi:hypothetical protein